MSNPKRKLVKDKDGGILKSLRELNEAIEAGSNLEDLERLKSKTEGNPIVVTDLSIPYYSLLTRATEKAFSVKVNTLNPRRIDSSFISPVEDKILFFSAHARGKENVYKAAKRVMEDINKLSAQGIVTGCFAPLSYLKLYTQDFELDAYAVFCFVSVPADYNFIDTPTSTRVNEGQTGPVIS